ncbi:MAG: N-acetylmuramoyl-L-alanine amidase [Leptolyngbyaceae cyanobacterium]
MAYTLRFKIDTWLKQAKVQATGLPDSQRQFVNARTVLPVSAFTVDGNHLRVTLGKDDRGEQLFFKGRNTWFVYTPAADLLNNGQVINPNTRTPTNTSQNNRSPYTLRIDLDTWLKQSTAQSSTLPDDQRQLVQAGTTLPISSFEGAGQFHLQIILGVNEQGQAISFKGRRTWFVYRPAVEVLRDGAVVSVPPPLTRGPQYTLKVLQDTVLKLSTAQSSALPDSQKQFIRAGTSLPIQSFATAGSSHLRVAFGLDGNGKQIFFKGRNTWFVYRPTVEILRDGVSMNRSLAGKRIVLDPGHGEIDFGVNDPGAVNRVLGRNERDEVRKQAIIIRQVLAGKGANVAIVENNTRMSLRQIGQAGSGADCFVSLHLNAFNRQAQGHEVFYHTQGTSTDRRFADLVNRALANSLNIPDRGTKRLGLAVLSGVPLPTPAILTEAFFIDSVSSAATLDRWNTAAANAIAQGITQFLLQ